MLVFTVSLQFLLSCRARVVPQYARAHALCACRNPPWGWPCGGERTAHNLSSIYDVVRLRHHPFATLSLSVVCRTYANLRYRPSTSRAFRTSPLPPLRATVVTRLCRTILLVSRPNATRRALGQSRRGSLWWSTPPPGRGRGTGWERNPFGARREQGVCRWMTPLTGEIPALSGAAVTTTCQL